MSIKYLIVIILIISVIACSNNTIIQPGNTDTPTQTTGQVITDINEVTPGLETTITPTVQPYRQEVEVSQLRLPERIESTDFEYSGMAWFGETLVLLPQFPEGKDFSRPPFFLPSQRMTYCRQLIIQIMNYL